MPNSRPLALLLAFIFGFLPFGLSAAPVAVRHVEGVGHAFLVLRTLRGKTLAVGDLIQVTHDDQVTLQFTLHFKDGSLHDETTIYSQRNTMRLLSDHLVQKGPSFPHPLETFIDASKGRMSVHYFEHGEAKVDTEQVDVPNDAANGLLLNLIKNIDPATPQTTVSMLAATPKPRIVKLVISPAGQRTFSVGDSPRKATEFVIKMDIGGVAGVVAPLVGKSPPDTHVWVYGGDAPQVVKFEGALCQDGPIWRLEQATFAWH